MYNVTVRGQNRYNIQVKISSVMLRKVIHHLRTIFYVSNQRMMVSEGPYNEAISNIGLIFGWNARVYNFFFFGGMKESSIQFTMMNVTAFVIYGFVNSLISKLLFFQCV